jgi:hypothetical protein
MSVARYFPALVKYGDRLYVFDGIKEPEAYGSPVPPYDKPDPNYTTIPTVTTLVSAPTTTVTTIASAPTTTVAKSTSSGSVTTTTSSTTSSNVP